MIGISSPRCGVDRPIQAARTRLELAPTVADADPSLAIVEAGRALDMLQRLGAVRESAATHQRAKLTAPPARTQR